ncbi:MAG: AAA family ATPase [Chlamydiae bacterium]|nr:AAA family ATPase [Chlamydiota bacterium]
MTEILRDEGEATTLRTESLHGRKALVQELTSMIAAEHGMILIQGEPGVGKTALVEEIARRIEKTEIRPRKETTILRLKPKVPIEIGDVSWAQENILGPSAKKPLRELLEALSTLATTEKSTRRILFIEEFDSLFGENCPGRDVLLEELAALDTPGVLIIGTTSNPKMHEQLEKLGPDRNYPLASRIASLDVPQMSPMEMIQALKEGRNRYERELSIQLTDSGIEAIVLSAPSCSAISGKRGMNAAVTFLKYVAEYTANQKEQGESESKAINEVTINQSAVLMYRVKNSCKSPLLERSDFQTKHFITLPRLHPNISFNLLGDLVRNLQAALAARSICFVKANSQEFLRHAVQSFAGYSVALSVRKLLSDPRSLEEKATQLKYILEKMDPSNMPALLVLEDTDEFMHYWTDQRGKIQNPKRDSSIPDAIHGVTQAIIPALSSQNADAVHHFEALAQNMLERRSKQPEESNHAPIPQIELLEILANWMLNKSQFSIICCSPTINSEDLRGPCSAAIDVNPSAADKLLSPADVVNWLKKKFSDINDDFLEKLVFYIYSKGEELNAADLCYHTLQALKGDNSQEHIKIILSEQSLGTFDSSDLEAFFSQWNDLTAARHVAALAPELQKTSLLHGLSEALRSQNIRRNKGALLRVECQDSETAKGFISKVIKQYIDQTESFAFLPYELFEEAFPSAFLQRAYIEKLSKEGKKAFILMREEDLTDENKKLLKEFQETRQVSLCLLATSKQPEANAPSIADRLVQGVQGFVQERVASAIGGVQKPHVEWPEIAACKPLRNLDLSQREVFDHFFDFLLTENPIGNEAGKKALKSAYFFLLQKTPNLFSIDQMQQDVQALVTDVQDDVTAEAIGKAIFSKYKDELPPEIGEPEILYAIEPALAGPFYRLRQTALNVGKFALQKLLDFAQWTSQKAKMPAIFSVGSLVLANFFLPAHMKSKAMALLASSVFKKAGSAV